MTHRQRKRERGLWIGLLAVLILGLGAHAQTIVGPDQMNFCDTETFTTTITNASVTQSACLLEIARSYTEAGVDYVPGTTTITLHDSTILADDPTGDSWDVDALLGSAYTLPPTESITIEYDLETTCSAVSGTEQVTVDFEDCADPGTPLQNVSSTSIEILPGAIVVTKLPSVQDARVGDDVTWTITVENTGLGRVDDIEITDILGPGLAYSSSDPAGSNAGQTTTWSTGSLDVGETVSVDLTAEVIACTGLYNDADAAFGCGPADTCFDTAVDLGTATASLNLIVDNPALSFTPPNVTVGYCTDETAGLVQITNSGAGTARSVELCCDLAHLQVDPARLPEGTTYADSCFQIPDVAPGATFDLTFYVLHSDIDWCAARPSGDNVFQLTYTNDCDIPFVAYPQFSTLSSESGPTLSVSKTGPDSLSLGETGSYDLAVEYSGSVDCGGSSPGPVTIVDTYPEGFTVIDPAGGTVDGGARTITWAYDPNVDPPFAETIQLEAPTDCGYCAQPGGGSDANSITATGTDCCGCPITGEASADTTILCEGRGGVDYFSSSMSLDRTTTVRCSSDYAVTVTHTYDFIDHEDLDDFLLNEFVYFMDGNGTLAYLPGSASVTGATLGTVVDNTPGGRLELPLTDSTSVSGKTGESAIVFEYTLIVQDLESSSCQASTIPINAGVDLLAGAPDLGFCGTMYADPAERLSVTAQPPAMDVSITGIPEVQEFCATYPVTITLTRSSADAKPYDVRLVLTNNNGSLVDMTVAQCGGGTYSPTDGTTCTGPIETATTYEWRYADLFDSNGDTAQIIFDVTVPCSGPLADLSVEAFFDDLCLDDDVYDNACSVSGSNEALLTLSADVYTRKSPEILYATTRDVEWSLVVHNTGNATAYNVWLDDVLGSGLVFDEANTVAPGATVTANEDHLGNATNGATFLFDQVDPGELITITFAADLVACDDLTNEIAAAWGCGGSDCQLPRTDDSIVVIPPANLIATSFSPTPIPMCSTNPADVTVKNAGVTTVYNIIDTVTLPDGLVYLGNPEIRVNQTDPWVSTGEPTIVGQTLTWTQTETPELASADPNDVIEIRFEYTVFCDFEGGDLEFQATYEDPCGDTAPTNIGRFALGLTPASVSTALRQIDPAPGEALDCGGEATWEIDIVNTGTVELAVVQVEAILDAGLTFVSSSGDPVYGPADDGADAGQSVYWELEDLPVDAKATFQVTAQATTGPSDCEALAIDVISTWGCGDVDGLSASFDASCTTTSPDTSSIEATREPPLDLTAFLSPGSIEACADTTELTLEITNDSVVATTSNIDFVITLPDELSYVGGSSEIDCGVGYEAATDPSAAGQTLTWYDVGSEGEGDDACESIPPGGTIRLRFDVDVSCYFTTQDIPIAVYSYDCCGLTQYDTSTSVTLTSLLPALSVDKTPSNTNLDCYDAGDTVEWTVTITNSGTGVADWVRLVDTLGANLVVASFTDLVDATPSTVAVGSQVGQSITWEADNSLAPGESLSTTVTAYATQPSDDCSRSLRQNTAVATWGCGTLAAPTCEYGTAIQDQSTVRVPNLDIDSADITPIFSCDGDGITPGSGQLQITVRNQGSGDAPITEDFAITVTEPNTGFSVSDTFVGLGGTLPLNDNTPQTLTLGGWDVACTDCTYEITATLDTGDAICECAENDDQAVLAGTITLPDLTIDDAPITVTCSGDGQIWIQGPLTLRNDGCGNPVTGDLRLRFRLFDDAACSGTEIDTFTETWTAIDIASGGGTIVRDIDRVRPLDTCALTQVSVSIEVDDDDQVCECSAGNNTLCVGPFALALPDLSIQDVSVLVPNACGEGTIDVTVENVGSGDALAGVAIRITGDATGETITPDLASGASTVVSIPLDAPLVCGPKTITVTIDPDDALCECSDGSNTTDVGFTVADPDLATGDLVAACQPGGTIRITATVSNNGDEVSGNVTLRVLLDGVPIETSVIALDPAETVAVDVLTAPVACGVEHTIRVDIDASDAVCECDETNNSQETTATCPCPALSVDKIITDILRGGASVGTTGPIEPGDVIFYQYTTTNVAAGTAYNVDITDTLPAGLVYETDAPGIAGSYAVSDPTAAGALGLVDGAGSFSASIGVTVYGGETLTAEYSVIATSTIEQGTDLVNVASTTGERPDGSAIPGENADLGDTSDGDAEDPDPDDTGITVVGAVEPALSVNKTITDIVRPGDGSLGIVGPVEPGDTVSYQFVIRNVGGATAYGVEFTDTLPPGMVTAAGGTYSVSAPSTSGLLNLSAGAAVFTTAINATIYGDETLTANFDALVTSDIEQGVDLVNTAEATGFDGFCTEIPDENPAAGDTDDYDTEDPDADDTGIAVIGTEEPALSVDKIITDIVRRGSSIGAAGPVEPGDVVFYRYTIRNVGLGTAYAVEFTDTLPTGLVTETDAPGDAGSWTIDDPSASGTLAIPDAVGTFTTSLGATIAGDGQLVADYTVYVTSDVRQGVDLINVAATVGIDGGGNPIPGENADIGDLTDDDEEDGDADDTGITEVTPAVPALDVDKQVVDVIRAGASIGVVDPVLFGDVIVYEYSIRNVGLGTAYGVDFTDTLPGGLETETGSLVGAGSYNVDSPSASGNLALADGATSFTTSIDAEIAGGGTLTATYAALIRTDAPPAVDLVNVAETTGEDGAGTEIPDSNADVNDTSDVDGEDPDADDTGIASVRVGFPALVTTKAVASIERNGLTVSGSTVEPGDVVTYEVTVTNVGNGPALNVDLEDTLPVGFVYDGNTDAAWPAGSSTADPAGTPGPSLTWSFSADLDADETLVVLFDTRVTGDIAQGAAYINTVTALGEDAGGVSIPPDQSGLIPEDDDPDDTSDVSLVGAIPALVTDKRVADIVRGGQSLGPNASIETGDRILYDMAIANVGHGTAYGVDVRDVLPAPFVYVSGSTDAQWPLRFGSFTVDPIGAPGLTLSWSTNATLVPGDVLRVQFVALIDGPINSGTAYTNTLFATGEDGAGRPIPPNSAVQVPADDDPDDQDAVTLTGGDAVPALVTTKSVAEIRRAGARVSDSRIEESDTVRYELTVRNVGGATAFGVGIDDTLPPEFTYDSGSTNAQWPGGSATADPTLGAQLLWALGATLRPNEQIVLRFDAAVLGPLFDGNLYINRMHAFGEDGSGAPIPENQRGLVPEDSDPDDASQVNLTARSSVVQGEGGEIIPVPILRKTAEVLGDGACEGLYAEADRLWFQTDIAMYASAEFELLAGLDEGTDLLPMTLLPSWLRTVRTEAEDYALDNLLQVQALSEIGLPLTTGPRILRTADELGVTPLDALERTLSALAERAGLDASDRPAGEDWIVLEFAGGEPLYQSSLYGPLGPYGDWTVLDERIVGSAVGLGLVKQAMEASTMLAGDRPLDRYVGFVLAEAMANKILTIDEQLMRRDVAVQPYVPHVHVLADDGLVIEDTSSHLFDQLSLLWGLAEFARFAQTYPDAWSPDEPGLRAYLHARAGQMIGEVLTTIETRHLDSGTRFIDVSAGEGQALGRTSTENVALLLVALDAARDTVGPFDAERIDTLAAAATADLLDREEDGRFLEPGVDRDLEFWALASQVAGIRGLLVASTFADGGDFVVTAQAAFDVLEEHLWVDAVGSGLYATYLFDGDRTLCYTPLDVGLVVGALRNLAARSDDARSAHILSRLAAFTRSVVDDAALQLANATPFGAELTVGTGEGTIGALRYRAEYGVPAPVLQQRLCLDLPDNDSPCAGRSARVDDPWYQTDISMYATYVLQDRAPQIEDYADANLSAVVLHSTLGLGFDDLQTLDNVLGSVLREANLDPIALPYASGSPRLADAAGLDWRTSTFDDRILASAIGMTLLREAQELSQLLERLEDPKADLQAAVFLRTILEKVSTLQVLRMEGPDRILYIPNAVRFAPTASDPWTIVDASSTLFGQLSLGFGLAETSRLLADPRISERLAGTPYADDDWPTLVEGLLAVVLTTLEDVHFDPSVGVLFDAVVPTESGWIRGETVTTSMLGLTVSALEHIVNTESLPASLHTQARALLADEVSFLQRVLWESPGVYKERWSSNDENSNCEPDTLLGQLGALRALLAGHSLLGLEMVWVEESLDAFESRFWNDDHVLYEGTIKRLDWCVTPLELGLSIDTLDRAIDLMENEPRIEASAQSRDRLGRHTDRILDALWLQLPSSSALGDALLADDELSEIADRYAPVFDRRVCLRPPLADGGTAWAEPGDLIRYTVTADNTTDETFANLLLADTLTEGVTYVSSDPVGAHSDGVVSWPFDRFEPSESRTWSVTARVDEDTPLGESLINCATLTYTNVAGEDQPPREACADTAIQSSEGALGQGFEEVEVSYRTDEAMRLATALEELSRLRETEWAAAAIAHEVSLGNLGILLQESGLGLPLQYAPAIAGSGNPETVLAERLHTFALAAGLPSAPPFGAPVLVPFEYATPILTRGTGFAETSDLITPAALGQTLGREAAYLAGSPSESRLDAFLRETVSFIVTNQVEWLAAAMQSTETGELYLPGATQASILGDEVLLTLFDSGTTPYGQASLLLGLASVAQGNVLNEDTRRLAQELATRTLARLALHEGPTGWLRVYPAEEERAAVSWADLVVVAASLEAARDVLARDRSEIDTLLASLESAALAAEPVLNSIEECARIATLLTASRALRRPTSPTGARDAWLALRSTSFDRTRGRPVFSPQIRFGSMYLPGELAVLLEMLRAVALAFPDERLNVFADASSILEADILGARVQFTDPAGYWQSHQSIACLGLAPVFGRHNGDLPPVR